jgi:hypothetical protein
MNVDFAILVFITLVPASWLVFGVIGLALRTKGRMF